MVYSFRIIMVDVGPTGEMLITIPEVTVVCEVTDKGRFADWGKECARLVRST